MGSEHLLLALAHHEPTPAATCLRNAGLYPSLLRTGLIEVVGRGTANAVQAPTFTPRCIRILERAALQRFSPHCTMIDSSHLLLSLLHETEGLAIELIRRNKQTPSALQDNLLTALQGDSSNGNPYASKGRAEREVGTADSRLLEQFTRDMLRQASCGEFDPLIGRDEELTRLMQILIRRTKNNPVLLGEPGVGKTAVVEGLALRMAAGQIPESLRGKRLLSLDLSSMVAGTKYRGEFEDRVKNIVREVRTKGNIILFLDELHTIVGAGSAEGAIDAANILKPALSRGEIQMIGATTPDEYRRYIEKDAALERRFQPVKVAEPSRETALTILHRLAPHYEKHHQVTIAPEAIEAAVRLSARYLPERRLPDKAIDLIDEAASLVRLATLASPLPLRQLEDRLLETFQAKEAAIRRQNFEEAAMLRNAERDFRRELEQQKRSLCMETSKQLVDVDSVAQVLAQWTGIPATSLTQEERAQLLDLEGLLHRRVAGQEEAVRQLAECIRRGRSGLNDPKRPTGSFLFLGPTGVGKTELCKALAEAMFGSEDALLRFDMTEFSESHSISRLLGSPPGYIGFDEGGQLSEQVRRKPYCVVLFDELEKAHADIWGILLQIMDEGRLTDSRGRMIDFRSSVVVMTSNVGADALSPAVAHLGFSSPTQSREQLRKQSRATVVQSLKKTFRPEFLNRLDAQIIFDPLTQHEMETIAQKLLDQLAARLDAMGVALHYSVDCLQSLAARGFDPAYGARPLRRLLQNEVESPAAALLLSGELSSGAQLSLSVDGDGLQLTVQKAASLPA